MTMTYALLASMPMFVCGVLTLLLLLDLLQRPRRALRELTVFMAVATLLYMGHCVFFCREIHLIPITDTLYCTSNLLVYPLYYLYIKRLTELRTPLWHVVVLVVPALLCGMMVGSCYVMMSTSDAQYFIGHFLYAGFVSDRDGVALAEKVHILVRVVFMLEIVPILYLGFRRINRYDRKLEQFYSSPEQRRLTWVKLMLILFVVTSIISMVCNAVGRNRFASESSMLAIPSTLYSLLLLAIGYVGMKQQGIEEDEMLADEGAATEDVLTASTVPLPLPPDSLTLPGTSQPLPLPHQPVPPLRERIEQLMESEKLYLDPQLKLSEMVKRLGSNRNYVYQAINVEMGFSFAEYVNRKRVDCAVRLLVAQPELSLAEVATRSGFATPVSFYRNFKNIIGCSPNEYRKRMPKDSTTE